MLFFYPFLVATGVLRLSSFLCQLRLQSCFSALLSSALPKQSLTVLSCDQVMGPLWCHRVFPTNGKPACQYHPNLYHLTSLHILTYPNTKKSECGSLTAPFLPTSCMKSLAFSNLIPDSIKAAKAFQESSWNILHRVCVLQITKQNHYPCMAHLDPTILSLKG